MLVITGSAAHDVHVNRTYCAGTKHQRLLATLSEFVFGRVTYTIYLVMLQFNNVTIHLTMQKIEFDVTQSIELNLHTANKLHDFHCIYDQYTNQIYNTVLEQASRGYLTIRQICGIDINGHAFQWNREMQRYEFGKVFRWSEFFRGACEAERNRMAGSLLGQFVTWTGSKI